MPTNSVLEICEQKYSEYKHAPNSWNASETISESSESFSESLYFSSIPAMSFWANTSALSLPPLAFHFSIDNFI